jgi:DNA-binding MarR family transcriptional regulator
VDRSLPLPALLSQVLVAFIIEFDNEFEKQMPHRTANSGSTRGSQQDPWLVSMVMWSKFMRFIPEQGITVAELQSQLPISSKDLERWLVRLANWWGYLAIEHPAAIQSSKRLAARTVLRPTRGGRRAQRVWLPLTATIEKRWQQRFGQHEMATLLTSLRAVASRLDLELADSLPILGYGLFSRAVEKGNAAIAKRGASKASTLDLPGLLSKLLLAFAREFEQSSEVSLAISANVLRLLGNDAVQVKNLPRLAAVSKPAIDMALSFLSKRGLAICKTESPGSREKVVVLTAKGRRALDAYRERVQAIEQLWRARWGREAIDTLRQSLERLVVAPRGAQSPLLRGLEPYPDGWRAALPRPEGLPHFPMILHRGGFPDGS